jgi:hypothetical protein
VLRIRVGVRVAALVAAAVVVYQVSGCGTSGSAGPLQNLQSAGGPQFAIAYGLYHPGQSADFAAFVVNTGSGPVTLMSASLVPIPGHPAGRLVHLGVAVGHNAVAFARGWPPGIPVTKFRGASLRPGQSNIIFGFNALDLGRTYMAAGIRITYRFDDQIGTVTAWSAATACVISAHADSALANSRLADCRRLSEVAQKATERLSN